MTSTRRKQRRRLRKKQAKKRRQKPQLGFQRTGSPRLKMSDVIRHVAEPLIEQYGDTPEDLEWLLSHASLSWNLTLLPQDSREERFKQIAVEVYHGDPKAFSKFRSMYETIAERKERFYPELNYFILNYSFTRMDDNDVYFEVVYGH